MTRPDTTTAQAVAPVEAPTTHVLLIDDDPAYAGLVEEMLRFAGTHKFRLSHAEQLSEARDLLLDDRIACVLLDLSLPDARGLEGLGELRELAPDLPIVVLSELEQERLAIEAVRSGAASYLVKTHASGALLKRAVREALKEGRRSSKPPSSPLAVA